MKHYILLRPKHKAENESYKENGVGYRSGYLMPYPLLDNLEFVCHSGSHECYQKIGDTRNRVSLIQFKSEIGL